MSRVEEIEGHVKNLNVEELRLLREWFAAFDAEVWDRELEPDARNGKLRALAERALRDHEDGLSTAL
jgi:hypothetical protein